MATPHPTAIAVSTPTITPPPLAPLGRRAWAQPENCVASFPNTNPACSLLTSRIDACSSSLLPSSNPLLAVPEANPHFASCFCTQPLFSDLVACQNIHRQCAQDYAFDALFEGYRADFVSFCSDKVSVTTPGLDAVTVAPAGRMEACEYVGTACKRWERYRGLCEENYAGNLVGCMCQGQVQFVESVCVVDGGVVCPATVREVVGGQGGGRELSALWGYRECKTWLGVVGTLVSGSGYSRGATVSARPTDAPFVDFPLSYFDVPTDPVFTGTALPTDMPSVGERPGMSLTQVLGACLAVALWTQM